MHAHSFTGEKRGCSCGVMARIILGGLFVGLVLKAKWRERRRLRGVLFERKRGKAEK